MNALSANTQAILLLTAPLLVDRASDRRSDLPSSAAAPLTAREYNRLALALRDLQRQPADLLGQGAEDVLRACRAIVDEARARRLLERGLLLSQAVERWGNRAIWVLSRADAAYPRRLKSRLKELAPPVLYGCGDLALLGTGGLAVVGSRDVDDALVTYAEDIGQRAAEARQTVVSGSARGIDQAAMRGALRSGGVAVGVLADSLEKATMNRDHRNMLLGRRLALVSPYDPLAGFNVGNAMQRNKLIYALADAALVVHSDFDKGGTWAGATEQLEQLRFLIVYVRSTGDVGEGLRALQQKGAVPWPNPSSADELGALLKLPFENPAALESVERAPRER
jgi:predicted Rossmann fold nucleotide-binding protein DprA/Smf involved in DNA uptake